VGASFRALRRALVFALESVYVVQDDKVPTQIKYMMNHAWEGKKMVKNKPDILVGDS